MVTNSPALLSGTFSSDDVQEEARSASGSAPDSTGKAAGDLPQVSIEVSCFSTSHLPPDERYSAWLASGWPRIDVIYQTERREPFDATIESAILGEIILARTRITGMRYVRRLEDIRRSDFDPLIVNLMLEGLAEGRCDGRQFREEAGTFLFHDLARPSDHVSTASLTLAVIIPRAVAIRSFGHLSGLHGLVLGGASAELLLSHASRVWSALPTLSASSAPALGRSILDLLTLALAEAGSAARAISKIQSPLRKRAEELIETRLNSALTIPKLCRLLGVSRHLLFAAFQPEGGVQNYIRATRLARAKVALADLDRREPIGTIAVRLGFCDASHLTRLFGAKYGMTPRYYRRLVASGESS